MPTLIRSCVREIVFKVKNFFQKEKRNNGPLIPFQKVHERTAAATVKCYHAKEKEYHEKDGYLDEPFIIHGSNGSIGRYKVIMASDIISSLHLDKNTPNRVIVAKEINGCDSSFITSCILGHCIKSKEAVLCIATHNSLLHYQNIGLKMNYNLQKQIDVGLIHFLKLDEELVKLLIHAAENSLVGLFSTINETVKRMKLNNNVVHIILDGVSHFFDMQYSLREVNKFCNDLIQLNRGDIGSFVLCQCNVAHEDDVTHIMANLLCHRAHTVLEVRNLLSGLSADVSGHLTIKYPGHKFEDKHMYSIDIKPSRYLFKLFERGVKLFAPGTV